LDSGTVAVVVRQSRPFLVMPRGPKGEKRPADVIGAAVMVARVLLEAGKAQSLQETHSDRCVTSSVENFKRDYTSQTVGKFVGTWRHSN
jgi:hypothetical protein